MSKSLQEIEHADPTELLVPTVNTHNLSQVIKNGRVNTLCKHADGRWHWSANGHNSRMSWNIEGSADTREDAHASLRDAIRRMEAP